MSASAGENVPSFCGRIPSSRSSRLNGPREPSVGWLGFPGPFNPKWRLLGVAFCKKTIRFVNPNYFRIAARAQAHSRATVGMQAHYSTSWTLCGFRYGGIILRYLRSNFDTACIDANFLGAKSSESGFCNFRCFRKADFFVSSDLECFSVCIDTVRISNNVRLQDSNFWQSNFLS